MEDKQQICSLFLVTLQATRDGANISDLVYDSTTEIVTITYAHGHTVDCNVAYDSGCGMINDIMRGIKL